MFICVYEGNIRQRRPNLTSHKVYPLFIELLILTSSSLQYYLTQNVFEILQLSVRYFL